MLSSSRGLSTTLAPATTFAATSWAEAFRVALLVFLPIRVLLSVVGALALLYWFGLPSDQSLGGWLSWLLLEPWNRWDVRWYLDIARDGYGIADGRASFHPLLSLSIRLVGDLLGGNYLLAGLVVSNLACIVFLATLFRFLALSHSRELAAEAVRWALMTPISFVLLLPYTEPLLLCFTLLAFWYAHHDRWLAAGLCAALAALTKQPGAALIVPLLWAYIASHRGRLWHWKSLRVLIWLSLAPLAYLSFSLYRIVLDAPGTSPAELLAALAVSQQLGERWQTRFAPPWEWLVYVLTTPPVLVPQSSLEALLAVAGFGIIAIALRRERGPVVIYGLIQVVLATTLLIAFQPLQSLARRLALVFPIYTQLGRWSLASRRRPLWFMLSTSMMCALATGFVWKSFVP